MADDKSTVQRILVVEDSEMDYEILLATLSRGGRSVWGKRVETESEMKAALAAETWDAVISDHNLPQFSSEGALATLKASGQDLPFIIVSGDIGEDVAVEAMRNGADDYLIKGRTKRLSAALAHAVDAARTRNERRLAEVALVNSAAKLRQLALHLETVKERERALLARDLQDNVATNLTAATLLLAHLRRQLPAANDNAAGPDVATLQEIETMISNAIQHCNSLTQGLRPDLLDCGLIAAVEWQVGEFSKRTGIASHFESNRDEVALDDAGVLAAFRFVEEALDNIHKHARATSIECIVFTGADNVTIEVSDDGAGFSAADLERTGRFGLIEIRERLASLDGELDISSGEVPHPRGATVMLTLPFKSAETPAGQNDGAAHD